MNPSSIVLQTVRERLKEAAINKSLGEIQEDEITSNPNDLPPAISGQQWLSVNIVSLYSKYTETIKWTWYRFTVSHIVRVRDIPNDRFEELYIDDGAICTTHDEIIKQIATYNSLTLLRAKISSDYNIKDLFKHTYTTLQPTVLYPSFFGNTASKDHISTTKIAGFKTSSIFTSPAITEKINLQNCN